MKLLAISATNTKGISKKNNPAGTDYDITSVTVLVPFEDRQWDTPNGSGATIGYGLSTVDMQLEPTALNAFKDLTFPAYIDADVETMMTNGRPTPVVKGFKKAA